MTRTVQIPDLAEQIAEIVADPTAYVRRSRELARQSRPVLSLVESPTQKCLIHMTPDVAHCNGCAADRLAGESA